MNLVIYYGILLVPLVFWWSWQTSSLLAWLSILACFIGIMHPYREALRAEWAELTKHTKSGSGVGKWMARFGGKTISAFLLCIFFLIPNFFTFWMYLSSIDLIFWVFFALFPLIFIGVKQNSEIMDTNRAIVLNSTIVALFPSVVLALIEAFIHTMANSSKMGVQVGADFALDYSSAFFHCWSEIIDRILFIIFSFLPWTEFWVTLFSNFFAYFGVFFVLALMLHLLPFNGNSTNGESGFIRGFFKSLKSLLQNKTAIISLAFFTLLILIAISTKVHKIGTDEDSKQKLKTIEYGVEKIMGKENMIDISEYMDKNPDDLRCGWFRRYILFGVGCDVQDAFADAVEEKQKQR